MTASGMPTASPPTPLLLYAVYDATRTDPNVIRDVCREKGIQQQSVQVIHADPLRVLASPVSDVERLSSPSVDEILAFKRVVEAAFAGGPLIPLRFGTVVRSVEEAVNVANDNTDTYADLLERLEGQVEMGVSLTLAAGVPEEPSEPSYSDDRPGTAYLLARQQRMERKRRRAEEAAAPFREALGPLATAATTSPRHGADDALSLAFLVPREQADMFRRTAENVSAPSVTAAEIVGPWAPYSFV